MNWPARNRRQYRVSAIISVKAVFLITDGYSNGGDPRPAAELLKTKLGVHIFTFGIRNGNVKVNINNVRRISLYNILRIFEYMVDIRFVVSNLGIERYGIKTRR